MARIGVLQNEVNIFIAGMLNVRSDSGIIIFDNGNYKYYIYMIFARTT
jgi:hypothetical protein